MKKWIPITAGVAVVVLAGGWYAAGTVAVSKTEEALAGAREALGPEGMLEHGTVTRAGFMSASVPALSLRTADGIEVESGRFTAGGLGALSADMDSVRMTLPDQGTFRVERLTLDGVTQDVQAPPGRGIRVGSLVFHNVSGDSPEGDGTVSAGRITVEDVRAGVARVVSLRDGGFEGRTPDGPARLSLAYGEVRGVPVTEVADFAPSNFAGAGLEGLEMTGPDGVTVTLGAFGIEDVAWDDGVLTGFRTVMEDFVVVPPPGEMPEEMAKLGYDTPPATEQAEAIWRFDPETSVARFESSSRSPKAVHAEFAVEAGNMAAFADLSRARDESAVQAALGGMARQAHLREVAMSVTDAGLIPRVVKAAAEEEGADPAAFRDMLVSQARQMEAQLGLDNLGDSVATLLREPGSTLSVRVAAREGRELALPMLMMAMAAPNRLREALEITISATEG